MEHWLASISLTQDINKMGKRNIEWNQQRAQAMTWLRQSFPCIFSSDIKPLKKGITQDILALNLDGTPTGAWVSRAIGYYVRSNVYLRQMKSGAYRFNLEGQADGDVTEDEAESAKAMLVARQEKSRQKAAQIKRERETANEFAQEGVLMSDAPEEKQILVTKEAGTKKILTLKKKAVSELDNV